MKTLLLLTLGFVMAGTAATRGDEPRTAGLEVHEWGTFTVLSGSDGTPLLWYQPGADLDQLPVFVTSNPFGGKSNWVERSMVRMETPVLYFYPKKEMQVKVSATYEQGRITEWFPAPLFSPRAEVVWEGTLHRPDDTETLKRVPEVAARGEHYRHAREVPDAWLYRSRVQQPAGLPAPFPHHDTEKFIFYRGVGGAPMPYFLSQEASGRLKLRHAGQGPGIEVAFALRVSGGKASWTRLPTLPAAGPEISQSGLPRVTATLDAPSLTLDQAEKDLKSAMETALAAAGLTPAEARAMVATWQGHWFREPGTRVLAILPRKHVDAMVPLSITPRPDKLERVFVTRFELLTSEREFALLDILDQAKSAKPDPALTSAFKGLELGRFAQGALVRAQTLQSRRMEVRFGALKESAAQKAPETAAR